MKMCEVETKLHVKGQPICPKCCDALEAERELLAGHQPETVVGTARNQDSGSV